MNHLGRRWSLAGSFLLCAFTCVSGGFVHHGNVQCTGQCYRFLFLLNVIPYIRSRVNIITILILYP